MLICGTASSFVNGFVFLPLWLEMRCISLVQIGWFPWVQRGLRGSLHKSMANTDHLDGIFRGGLMRLVVEGEDIWYG